VLLIDLSPPEQMLKHMRVSLLASDPKSEQLQAHKTANHGFHSSDLLSFWGSQLYVPHKGMKQQHAQEALTTFSLIEQFKHLN
jgi:hypothetical protein